MWWRFGAYNSQATVTLLAKHAPDILLQCYMAPKSDNRLIVWRSYGNCILHDHQSVSICNVQTITKNHEVTGLGRGRTVWPLHIQTLPNIRTYKTQCLIQKNGCKCLALVNTGTTIFFACCCPGSFFKALTKNVFVSCLAGIRWTSCFKRDLLLVGSVAVLDEIPLRSAQKLFICIIKKIICWLKVSKNKII